MFNVFFKKTRIFQIFVAAAFVLCSPLLVSAASNTGPTYVDLQYISQSSFTGDGQVVYGAKKTDGNWYVVKQNGGAVTEVGPFVELSNIIVSPDSSKYAFINRKANGNYYASYINASAPSSVVDYGPYESVDDLFFSSDSQKIAFVADDLDILYGKKIMIINLSDGMVAAPLTTLPSVLNILGFNGQKISYYANTNNGNTVYTKSLSDGTTSFQYQVDYSGLNFLNSKTKVSPDLKVFSYVVRSGSYEYLYLHSDPNQAPKEVAHYSWIQNGKFSNQASLFSYSPHKYSGAPSSMFIANPYVNGGSTEEMSSQLITAAGVAQIGVLGFKNSQLSVAYSLCDNNIKELVWIKDLLSGKEQIFKLAQSANYCGRDVGYDGISPDFKKIAYKIGNRIVLEDLDTEYVAPRCGDNKIDSGEVCDGSSLNNQTCSTKGFNSGSLSCSADCKSFVTTNCVKTNILATCYGPMGATGYSRLNTKGEVSGTNLDGSSFSYQDKCFSSTKVEKWHCETSHLTPWGDHIIEGYKIANSMLYGCDSGSICENGACRQSSLGSCGNGSIDSGEVCDGSKLNNQTCSSKGYAGGSLSCASDCKSFNTASCTTSTSCVDSDGGVDYYAKGTTSGPDWLGNPYKVYSDECLAGSTNPETLLEYYCDSSGKVTVQYSGCPGLGKCVNGACVKSATCGNDTIDSGEVCDGSNLNNQTCSTKGFLGGILKCSSDCKSFDTNVCLNNCSKVRPDNSSNIYIINDSEYRKFINEALFISYGYKTSDVVTITPPIGPVGSDISTVEEALKKSCPGLSTAIVPTCSDTDDKNVYNKGYVSGIDSAGKTYANYDECNGLGTQIKEAWCYELNGGKVPGTMVSDCPFGCADGACKGAVPKTDVKSKGINCSDALSKFTYLSGFNINDTFNSIINDEAKLRTMVDQAVTNKALIDDLGTPLQGLNKWPVPLTRAPLFGQCKWVEHWDTEYCYVYSYKTGGKVGAATSPRCTDTAGQKLEMIKAIKNGYCCGGETYVEPKPSATCGNGVIEGNEYCDGSNIGWRTCQTMGYESGTLKCASDCQFDRSACVQKRDIALDTITKIVDTKSNQLVLLLPRPVNSEEKRVMQAEQTLSVKVDPAVTKRLAGKVLLQAESKGEAWFVDGKTGNKFYMQDGNSAYEMLKTFGLGVGTSDLDKIPLGYDARLVQGLDDDDKDSLSNTFEEALGSDPLKSDTDGDGFNDAEELKTGYRVNGSGKYQIDPKLVNRLGNGIVLQVQGANSRGQAWLMKDGYRYYIDPRTAYNAMRYLSLGVNNDNIRKIQTGGLQ